MQQTGDEQSSQDALSDEAIEWFVRLSSGRATRGDHAAFRAWRRRSPAHEAAAREAEQILHGVQTVGTDRMKAAGPSVLSRRSLVLGGGTAAAASLAVVASGVLTPWQGLFADHTTRVGERRSVTLDDGSSVLLNTASAFSTSFSERERRVTLRAGQAMFSVVSDRRPFVVSAGVGEVRALGTVFDVDGHGADTAVTVVEGAVEVRTTRAPIVARADQRVRYDANGLYKPEALDARAATAWQRGKLIFDRRSLGDVVAEIERYRRGRIIVADQNLARMQVTGVFDLDDSDALLRAITEALPVRIVSLPYLTILR